MDATLGQAQRQTQRLVVFFVTLALALLVGLAGGYGIRAWTSSSSTTVAAGPVTHAVPQMIPGYGIGAWATGRSTTAAMAPAALPDRSDVLGGANNSKAINHSGDARLGGSH